MPDHYDPDGFRQRHGIDGPFVAYAGRREGGKSWDALLDAFARAVTPVGPPLSLVTMGPGVVDAAPGDRRPGHRPRVRERRGPQRRVRRGAAYIQPSAYESFSRTIMEAWLAGTLVIANGASAVVRWHCERAGAGLIYDDDEEFEQCLRFVAEAPEAAAPTRRARPRLRARALHLAAGPRRGGAHHRHLAALELTCASWWSARTRPPATGSRTTRCSRSSGSAPLGHDVEVLSPGPSAAHHHLDLIGVRGGARAGAPGPRLRPGDRPVPPGDLHPDRIDAGGADAHLRRVGRGLDRGPRGRAACARVPPRGRGDAGRGDGRPAHVVGGHDHQRAHRPGAHGARAGFGLPVASIAIAEHGADFERRTSVERSEARARLGLPDDGFVFLSIGFLQPHKGFDRAVRAFAGLGEHGCRLEVVGSLRSEDTEYVAYVDELREHDRDDARRRPCTSST